MVRRRERPSGLYEGFVYDPGWSKMPAAGYLDDTIADLRRLPQLVQTNAVLMDVGEASWPYHLVEGALGALADLGCGLRHLYHVARDEGGGTIGIQQIENAGSPDDELTRRRMINTLVHLPNGERGYIISEVRGSEGHRQS